MFWLYLKNIQKNRDYEASIQGLVHLFSEDFKNKLNHALTKISSLNKNLKKAMGSYEFLNDADMIWNQAFAHFSKLQENFKKIKSSDYQQVKLLIAQSIIIINFFEHCLTPVYKSKKDILHANESLTEMKAILTNTILRSLKTNTNLSEEEQKLIHHFFGSESLSVEENNEVLTQPEHSQKKELEPFLEEELQREIKIATTQKSYLKQLNQLLDQYKNNTDKELKSKIAVFNELQNCISNFPGWIYKNHVNIPYLVLLSQENAIKIIPSLRRFLQFQEHKVEEIIQFYKQHTKSIENIDKITPWQIKLAQIKSDLNGLEKQFHPVDLYESSYHQSDLSAPPAEKRRIYIDEVYLKDFDYPNSGKIVKADDTYKSLFNAVKEENVSFVENFITQGNDPINRIDKNGYNILHYAVETGNAEMVELICLNMLPKDINLQGAMGNTPLHIARGNIKITKLLISYGAQASNNLPNRFFTTPNVDSTLIDMTPKFDKDLQLSRN